MPAFLYLLIYIIIFLYGIVIGSFLNVCIFRVPKKESILTRSHCMNCGYTLRWYDLFPVFSFLLLRGRCRKCKTKLSIQYPLIEGLNGILYVAVFLANGFEWSSMLYCLMTSALIVISVIDERTFEIPVQANIFILCLGIISVVLDLGNWSEHVIGMVSVSVCLYFLYVLSNGQAIGGGDVKLMGAAGLLLGWKDITLAFFVGCILGAFIHVIRMKISSAEHRLAMGPYLATGIFICALWGDRMIQWYLSMIGL